MGVMTIKTRLFWIGWGPDIVNMRGWWFTFLLLPRPDLTPIGMRVRGLWCLDIRRSGPSLMFTKTSELSARRWTGLEYDWPPSFEVTRG